MDIESQHRQITISKSLAFEKHNVKGMRKSFSKGNPQPAPVVEMLSMPTSTKAESTSHSVRNRVIELANPEPFAATHLRVHLVDRRGMPVDVFREDRHRVCQRPSLAFNVVSQPWMAAALRRADKLRVVGPDAGTLLNIFRQEESHRNLPFVAKVTIEGTLAYLFLDTSENEVQVSLLVEHVPAPAMSAADKHLRYVPDERFGTQFSMMKFFSFVDNTDPILRSINSAGWVRAKGTIKHVHKRQGKILPNKSRPVVRAKIMLAQNAKRVFSQEAKAHRERSKVTTSRASPRNMSPASPQ